MTNKSELKSGTVDYHKIGIRLWTRVFFILKTHIMLGRLDMGFTRQKWGLKVE